MKTLTLQIFGLVFNLFLVFIIISYSNANLIESGGMRNSLALKKISILLI